ncbi:MAG TPA: polysaccharide biosynthesis/export family protein [Vicinamibacterales bacterium]|jgi:polysaccharide export outer membrane protein
MSTTFFVSFALAAVLQLSAAPPTPKPATEVLPSTSGSYRIGAQDQLLITVADEPELSGKFRVDNDGSFIFPYLGRVAAAGKTLAEIQGTLSRDLANGYLKNPQVRVEIDQYKSQSVFVSGEVRSPGKIMMAGSTMTLLEALGQAGSPTPTASTEIVITRRGSDPNAKPEEIRVNRREVETGRAAQDFYVRDGDVIFVPKAETFYISGLVRNPGSYVLDPGMTVEQAIALAGGLTERGSDRGIVITRMVNGIGVDLGVSKADKVHAGDTVKVRGRFF